MQRHFFDINSPCFPSFAAESPSERLSIAKIESEKSLAEDREVLLRMDIPVRSSRDRSRNSRINKKDIMTVYDALHFAPFFV